MSDLPNTGPRNSRVLVTTPDTSLEGGVASFYRCLRSFLPQDVHYFIIGRRRHANASVLEPIRLATDYLNFLWELLARRYDVVHLNPSLGNKAMLRDAIFLVMAKLFRKRVIVFIHGWDVDYERRFFSSSARILRSCYALADCIVVLASEFRDKLALLGWKARLALFTTAVEEAMFSLENKSTREEISLLFLSRIEKEKGIYEALDAFRIVRQRHPLVTLTVAGSGSELANAKRYVAEQHIEGVSFLGFVAGTAKDEVFRNADIYFFPTFYGEGMPISVLEAMACGLSVVTRPVGGLKDFFVDGKMGFVTVSRDPEEFARLLDLLISDSSLREEINIYNKSYARAHFAASVVAGEIMSFYEGTVP